MQNEYLAVIDCGTNSFHMIIVKLNKNGGFEIVDRTKEVIRLGLSGKPDVNHIKDEVIQKAINTLNGFKIIAKSYNALIRAFGTSAVRESLNRDEFIAKVLEETGIEIEVISGFEEARLIYTGVIKAVPVFNQKALCIDIGGGSTEFVLGQHGKIIYVNSVKLGAVQLSQMFFPDFKLTKQRIEKCNSFVAGEIYPAIKEIEKYGFDVCIGASGTIMSTAVIIQAKRIGMSVKTSNPYSTNAILNNFTFTQDELRKITETILNQTSIENRKRIPGLDENRADVFPAGIIILSSIVNELNIKEITVASYTVREGIVVDTISN